MLHHLAGDCAPKLPPFSGNVSINEGDYYEAVLIEAFIHLQGVH